MNDNKLEDGIKLVGKKCACGSDIRLHVHTFTFEDGVRIQRYYMDCQMCGKVTNWYDNIEDAAKAFDEGDEPEYQTRTEDAV